jgi:hypothetical protein
VKGCRGVAWLASIPLVVAGSQVAHWLAYWFVYPQAELRLRDLVATGHGYMLGPVGFLPLVLGAAGALELVAIGWAVACVVRRCPRAPVPAWAFALLPLVGFTLQECFERWLAGSSFPWWVVEQPTFRVGLLLQLPFALVAFLLARYLLRVADEVGRALRAIAQQRLRLTDAGVSWSVRDVRSPRGAALANCHASRGPPVLPRAPLFHG